MCSFTFDAAHLCHDGSAQSQERCEGQEEKGQPPLPHKTNDEATKEGGYPLDEQRYLITNTIMDLVYITKINS